MYHAIRGRQLLVTLAPFIGTAGHRMLAQAQHYGLSGDHDDFRANSRTVLLNPLFAALYWQMNYHIEHHMFPMVPYHALPKLHALIKNDLPPPSPSIAAGYREMWPAVKRQLRYEDYFLMRELPPTAKPYKAELHDLEAARIAAE